MFHRLTDNGLNHVGSVPICRYGSHYVGRSQFGELFEVRMSQYEDHFISIHLYIYIYLFFQKKKKKKKLKGKMLRDEQLYRSMI